VEHFLHHGGYLKTIAMKRLVPILMMTLWTGTLLLQPGVSKALFSFHPDSIRLTVNDQQLRLPGESFQIGVTAFYKNGKTRNTTGFLGGSVLWWRYKVIVTGGDFSSGKVEVNRHLVPSRGKYISIKVYPRKHPEQVKELLLPLNYETDVQFRATHDFDKSPGSRVKGELVARFDNGMVRIYENLNSREASDCYEFLAEGGTWDRGQFTIDPDFTRIVDHQSDLIVHSLRNQMVSDTFSVVMDYKHDYRLSFTGMSGSNGFSGSDGSDGFLGNHGEDGYPGQDGQFGEDGPDVGVWTDLYRDSILGYDLLYVYAENFSTGQEFRYLINPEGGSLTVISGGGDGGHGGSGGDGGEGGKGRDGEKWLETHKEKKIVQKPVVRKVIKKEKKKVVDAEGKEVEVEVEVVTEETVMENVEVEVEVTVEKQGPGQDGGHGGWGAPGGPGGGGGWGGNIELYFTGDASPWQNKILAKSSGGSGGFHGSGGRGGHGGHGGNGNPDGRNGYRGQDGPSAIGLAEEGYSGKITIGKTGEFFFYQPVVQEINK